MQMRYKLLGKSGLKVSELCLGTMTFGDDWGWGADRAESQKQFDLFTGAGGNFIDTANLYTNGSSEKLVGEFIHSDREHFVLATKYTLATPDTGMRPSHYGNSRKNMMHAVEASLKRLDTDYIDLYYLHAWDKLTPVEEVLRAMDDLVRQGKVNYFAFSDTPAWVIGYAVAKAETMGWTRPIGIQVPYDLVGRSIENEIIPMAGALDITVLPWGILRAGKLLGKYSKDSDHDGPTRDNPDEVTVTEAEQNVIDKVAELAQKYDVSRAQVCLNWVRQNPEAQIIPILGARTARQLEDNLACLDWQLSDEDYQALAQASGFRHGFPRTFIDNNIFIHGEPDKFVDNHRL